MNKTKIEWCDYSWNTITGCKNGCWYCYAKRIRNRFFPEMKFEDLANYDERLEEPLKKKKPSKIFVGSMTDLFATWQPKRNVKAILKIVEQCSQHTFIFLTKNPMGYTHFKFPQNCWLGVTVTSERDWWRIGQLVAHKQENMTFVSVEPMLAQWTSSWLYLVDWIILGALTGPGKNEHKVKREWLEDIVEETRRLKIPLFMKSSLVGPYGRKLIQEFPLKRRFD